MHDFGSIDGTGWKASIKKEIDRVVGFKAMEVISERKMRRDIDRCGYPERASIGNFVLAFRIKTDPDGGLLDPSRMRLLLLIQTHITDRRRIRRLPAYY
jgi:hypothetical protein